MKVYLNRGSGKRFLYFKKKCIFLFIYCIVINLFMKSGIYKIESPSGSSPALLTNFKFNQMKNINDIEVKDHIEVKTLEIKITKVIERDVLENIFVTALEGGSNYWCFLNKDAIALVRKTVPREIEPFLSIAILKAVLDHGVVVPVNDAENEDDILGYIDRDTIQDRLQRLAETNPSYLDVEIEGDGDATSSDVVFQSIVMNEIVFG